MDERTNRRTDERTDNVWHITKAFRPLVSKAKKHKYTPFYEMHPKNLLTRGNTVLYLHSRIGATKASGIESTGAPQSQKMNMRYILKGQTKWMAETKLTRIQFVMYSFIFLVFIHIKNIAGHKTTAMKVNCNRCMNNQLADTAQC